MPYETKEEILKLGELDPEFVAVSTDQSQLLKANHPPPVDYTSLEEFAAMAERRNILLRQLLGQTPPTVKRVEMSYPATDGSQQRAILYQPASPPSGGSPLIVMFHGGGWCIGAPEGEEQTCRNLVHAFGATCVSASYRLAPKWKFPQGVMDAWDALKWAGTNAPSFGADPSLGFIVGGSSAGGNLAAIMAHKARDHSLSPPLTGQYLAIPAVCPADKWPEKYEEWHLSWEQNKDQPVLPQAAVTMFQNGYAPDLDDGENFAIFNHPKGHKGLVKCFLQADGADVLRDDSIIYEKVLREEYGVETKMYVYPGVPHGHWGFFPSLKSSDLFRKEQMIGFGWLLGREPNLEKIFKDAKPAAV